MGEDKRDALRVGFDSQVRLEFHGANVTSDARLLAYRELDETLGLTTEVEELGIHDPCIGQNTRHSVIAMVRQSVYSSLAGYEDTDPTKRAAYSRRSPRFPRRRPRFGATAVAVDRVFLIDAKQSIIPTSNGTLSID